MPSVYLRERTLKNGVIGFYLDWYVGGRRYYDTLDIKIEPNYSKGDKKILRDKANSILHSKKSELLINKHPELFGRELEKGRGNFFVLFETMKNLRKETSESTYSVWNNVEKLLELFHGSKQLEYRYVNLDFCQKFLAFLRKYKHKDKGSFANGTILTYYRKFQSAMKEGHKIGLIKEDYSSMVKSMPQDLRADNTRDTLTIDEINAIKETPFFNNEIKHSFLFACFTGLRISDLRNLKWKNISLHSGKEGHENAIYLIELQQKKTKKPVVIPFTQDTFNLIAKKRSLDDENIFIISHHNGSASRSLGKLLKLVKEPSLRRKEITFHSARHTFGAMCVNSFDLYTTQRLMGHADHKSTIGYAQMEVKSLVKAVFKLPKLNS